MKLAGFILASGLATGLAFAAGSGAAQAPETSASETMTIEKLGEMLAMNTVLNEICKEVTEPSVYSAVQSVNHLLLEKSGASAAELAEYDAGAVSGAATICDGKAECWRSITDLPETATASEGANVCMQMLTESTSRTTEGLKQLLAEE